MTEKELEHWKLFYDTAKALFVLDDLLSEKFNWYYQELFYIKLVSFLDETIPYINKCKKIFVDHKLLQEWLQLLISWRKNIYDALTEGEAIFIHYRRHRAAHMFQDGYEYDPDSKKQNNIRILQEDGELKNYSSLQVQNCINDVTREFRRSDELDINIDAKIHPILSKMKTELNLLYNSYR